MSTSAPFASDDPTRLKEGGCWLKELRVGQRFLTNTDDYKRLYELVPSEAGDDPKMRRAKIVDGWPSRQFNLSGDALAIIPMYDMKPVVPVPPVVEEWMLANREYVINHMSHNAPCDRMSQLKEGECRARDLKPGDRFRLPRDQFAEVHEMTEEHPAGLPFIRIAVALSTGERESFSGGTRVRPEPKIG